MEKFRAGEDMFEMKNLQIITKNDNIFIYFM